MTNTNEEIKFNQYELARAINRAVSYAGSAQPLTKYQRSQILEHLANELDKVKITEVQV